MLLTCVTCLNHIFNVRVDSRPVHTLSYSVLALGDALVSMYGTQYLLPFARRDEEGFSMENDSILNGQYITVSVIWAKNFGNIFYVIRPCRDDHICDGTQERVILNSSLVVKFFLRIDVYKIHRDIKFDLRCILW